MGEIRITDGVTSREIRVPQLSGTVEVVLAGEDAPAVVVPAHVTVRHRDSESENRA